MASSLRLPVGSFLLSTQSSSAILTQSRVAGSYQCRSFSQAPQRWAKAKNMMIRNPSLPSLKTRNRQQIEQQITSHLPNDIGLLQGTFIRPLWRDMPSIFERPRDRLHMEWAWARSKVQDLIALLTYCKNGGNNTPLQYKERRKIARGLQENMYKAFANGDTQTIRKICCSNLADNLISQIEARPKGEEVIWLLTKYLRTPGTYFTGLRIMSDRATDLQDLPDSGVRQIVVRITSRQVTSKKSAGASYQEAQAAAKEQDCTEYVVIQAIRWQNQDFGWMVWGHVRPTTLHTVLTDPHFKPGMSLWDRLSAIRESAGMR